MGELTERERIARIIDPVAFRVNDGKDIYKPGTMQSSCDDARAKADAILAEHRATIAALVGALEDIAIYGCGMLNQPAALNGPEEEWLRKRITRYEEVARAALQLARGGKSDE